MSKHLDEILTIKGINIWNLGDYINGATGQKTFDNLDPNKTYSIIIKASSDFATESVAWSVSPRNADDSSRGNLFYMRDYVAGQAVSAQFTGAYKLCMQTNTFTGDLYVCLVEGTSTKYEPYIGEFKSIGEVWQRAVPTTSTKGATTTINNTRKSLNLYDCNQTLSDGIIGWDGAESPSEHSKFTQGYLKIKPNTKYTFQWGYHLELNPSQFRVSCYTADKTFISTLGGVYMYNEQDYTFTTPVNAEFVRFSFDARILNCDFMCTEGQDRQPNFYPHFSPEKVLSSLKGYGGTIQRHKQNKLWSRYVPCEYVESSGTQYIDTGFKPNPSTTKCKTRFTPLATGFLFGARTATSVSNNENCNIYAQSKTSIREDWICSANSISVVEDSIVELEVLNQTLIINGTTYTGSITKGTSYLDNSFIIFGVNRNGTRTLGSSKNYGLRLWDNGVLVRDFIPVKDVVDNVYGMYDRVNDKFYGNAGTGSFTGGDLIQPISSISGVTPSTDEMCVRVSTNTYLLNTDTWTLTSVSGTAGPDVPYDLIVPQALKCNKGDIRYGYDDGAVIPSEYDRVEYITRNTNLSVPVPSSVSVNNNSKLEAVVKFPSLEEKSGYRYSNMLWHYFNDDSKVVGFYPSIYYGDSYDFIGYVYLYWPGGTTAQATFSMSYTDFIKDYHTFTIDKGKFYIDGTLVGQVSNETTFSKTLSTLAFAADQTSNLGKIQLSSLKIWDNDKLVYNSVSSKDSSNYGMYDCISKGFNYVASNTGGSVIARKLIADGNHTIYISQDGEMDIEREVNDLLYSANDYVDFQTGKRHNEWEITIFDGSESWTLGSSTYDGTCYLKITDCVRGHNTIAYCTHFSQANSSFSDYSVGKFVLDANADLSVWLLVGTTVNSLKAWLASEYSAGHPVIVIYPLATPTETDVVTEKVALNTKGSKTITSQAEISTTVQATCLSK